MQHRLLLLLSIATLVALPSSVARACGSHSDADHALKYHHHHEKNAAHPAHSGCDAGHNHADSERDHPDDEGSNHCHCPGCGGASGNFAGGLAATFYLVFSKPSEVWLQKQAFYFAEHLPEEVYLPIWQPPQLAG